MIISEKGVQKQEIQPREKKKKENEKRTSSLLLLAVALIVFNKDFSAEKKYIR